MLERCTRLNWGPRGLKMGSKREYILEKWGLKKHISVKLQVNMVPSVGEDDMYHIGLFHQTEI